MFRAIIGSPKYLPVYLKRGLKWGCNLSTYWMRPLPGDDSKRGSKPISEVVPSCGDILSTELFVEWEKSHHCNMEGTRQRETTGGSSDCRR